MMKRRVELGKLFGMLLVAGVAVLLLGIVYADGVTAQASARGPKAVQGDWPTYMSTNARQGENPAETVITAHTAANLKEHWHYQGGGVISSQPVVVNGVIYWGSWADGLEHATALNGNLIWATNIGTTPPAKCITTTSGVAGTATVATVSIKGRATSVVFIGGGDGHFYALSAVTGAILWRTALGSLPDHFIWGSAAVYHGSVYIGMSSRGDCPLVRGQLVQLNASTGALQHTFNVVPNGCLGGSVWGSPTIDASKATIYFTTGNNGTCGMAETEAIAIVEVQASDLALQGSWQVPVAEQAEDSDFGSTPTLFKATIGGGVQNLVGAVNKNGVFYAFKRDALGSGPIWQSRVADALCMACGVGDISSAAWDGTTLYVAGGRTTIGGSTCKGSLRAVNPVNGVFLWEDCFSSGEVFAGVALVPGVAVVGAGQDVLVVATASGALLTTLIDASKHSLYYGSASIAHGVLYIGNADGILHAYGL